MNLSPATLKEIERRVADRQDAMVSFLRSLVESESPSGDVAGSLAVVDLIAREAGTLTCVDSIERYDVPGMGQHLVLQAFSDLKSHGAVLIVGHTDTVHPRGAISERPWRVEGERIYGPGIFDMKASIAVVLNSLRACEELNIKPRCAITIVLTCDEEVGSFSGWPLMNQISESIGANTAFVLEPPGTGGSVKTGRKGTGIYEMRIHGRASHAGLEPEKGASAVHELARQIESLSRLGEAQNGIRINFGVIEGGTRANVVAAEARTEIDIRFATAEEAAKVSDTFASVKPFDERVKVEISGGINRPPMERSAKVLELYDLAAEVAKALEFELGETQVGGASDGNFLAAKGLRVLDGLGVPGAGAHAVHEHIIASELPRRAALLAGLFSSV